MVYISKAWRLFDYSISQFVLHSVWLILVQWSGTYTHLDGIIFGICFFARQNNIDDTECLPNDPEVCNYLKEFISEFTEEFLCHLASNVTQREQQSERFSYHSNINDYLPPL